MKTLALLRHAKADPDGKDTRDHERALTGRGARDAERLGAWLAAQNLWPGAALASTSARTRQTLEGLARGAQRDLPAAFAKALYLATPGQILTQIQHFSGAEDSLMIVGHNPGLHQLARMLSAEGEREALLSLSLAFPTCALAVIELPIGAWREAGAEGGVLRAFVSGKGVSEAA